MGAEIAGIAIKLLAEVRSDCNVFGTIAIRRRQILIAPGVHEYTVEFNVLT